MLTMKVVQSLQYFAYVSSDKILVEVSERLDRMGK